MLKRYAPTLVVVLGLLGFYLISYIANRPQDVEASSGNLYTLDLQQDWLKIAEVLESEDLKLEDFRLHYGNDGEIRELRYQLVGEAQDHMMVYRVRFKPERKLYSIEGNKVDEWLQYERMVDARRFFEVLDTVELKRLKPKEQHESYFLQSDGWYTGFGIAGDPKYEIVKNQLRELHDSELAVKAVFLAAYGRDGSGSSDGAKDVVYYLFDVKKE